MENKKRILVIDNEKSFTDILKLNLEATGRYEVMVENKGSLGSITAKAFKPDLILLDIIMPDMEGSDVAAQLREDKELKDIPVVFLTAVATKEDLKDSGIIGGYPFIAKPTTVKEVVDCIEQHLKRY